MLPLLLPPPEVPPGLAYLEEAAVRDTTGVRNTVGVMDTAGIMDTAGVRDCWC